MDGAVFQVDMQAVAFLLFFAFLDVYEHELTVELERVLTW